MNKKNAVGVFSLGLALVFTGCGKGNSGSGLSSERLAAMKDVRAGVNEINDLQSGNFRVEQQQGQRSRLREAVDQAITAGRCHRTNAQLNFEISGNECPVFLQARITQNAADRSSKVEVQFHQNGEPMADVTQMDMSSETTQAETGSRSSFSMSGSSRKHGAFGISGSFDMTFDPNTHNMSLSSKVAFSLGGATTNFVITVENGTIHAKTSDGVALSEADANALFANGGGAL